MSRHVSALWAGVVALPLLLASGNPRASDVRADCATVRYAPNGVALAGCRFRLAGADAEQTARRFIELHVGEDKMPTAISNLVHVATARGLATQHVRFQQYLFGYPVFGGMVSAHFDPDGTLRRVHSRYDGRVPAIARGAGALGADAARELARQHVLQVQGGVAAGLTARSSRQLWYPLPDGTLALAWEVALTADRPPVDVLVFVDVASGAVVAVQDRLVRWVIGGGAVFRPNPIQASGDTTITDASSAAYVDSLRSIVSLPGLAEGTGLLIGRFVDVSVPQPPSPPYFPPYLVANEPSRQYVYEVADDRFTQVNAYYAIDSAQRYLRAIGFSDDRTVPNGIRGYPTIAYTHWNDDDVSFFRPATDTLHFGYGGIPDAEDGDIVVHEYGHAIQYAQNPNWGCLASQPPYPPGRCQMRAMGEGFSDYLAAVVHASFGDPAYQQVNAACIGEWDSTAYQQPPPLPTCLRRVDSDRTFPADTANLAGDIYDDGQIWSRALWDIRNALGGSVASQLILEHHFSLPTDATMPQAALEMLEVDADLFSGANEASLKLAFCARGILRDADCVVPMRETIVVPVAKDSLLREVSPNRNEGASPILRLRGTSTDANKTRIALAFDLSSVDIGRVRSAVLELVVANSDDLWDIHGRTVDVHPLSVDFEEGNGVNTGADDALKNMGTGSGVTWNCQADTNVSNGTSECALEWKGGRPPPFVPFGAGREDVPPVVHTSRMKGRVRWNVTADVKATPSISRWIVKKTLQDKPGSVDYFSKEGAFQIDPADSAWRRPRLVITYQ